MPEQRKPRLTRRKKERESEDLRARLTAMECDLSEDVVREIHALKEKVAALEGANIILLKGCIKTFVESGCCPVCDCHEHAKGCELLPAQPNEREAALIAESEEKKP
jgi:hypothetical protein